jgi:hypothetical protein
VRHEWGGWRLAIDPLNNKPAEYAKFASSSTLARWERELRKRDFASASYADFAVSSPYVAGRYVAAVAQVV